MAGENLYNAQDALTQKRATPPPAVDYNIAAAGTPPPTAGPNMSSSMLPGSTAGDVKPGPTVAPPAPDPEDPFAAQGGGIKINGNWFPKDHPGAIEWMKNHPQAAPAPGAPGPTTPAPTAPPTEPQPPVAPANIPAVPQPGASTSQGSTDMFNKAIRDLMGTKEVASVNDDVIKAQLDPMKAEAERAMRGEVRNEAEQAFAEGQDTGAPEKVAALERMGNRTGLAAGDLVARETAANRDKIKAGLQMYGDRMSEEQKNALTEKLQMADINLRRYLGDRDFESAERDRGLKKQGLDDARTLGGRELDIKDRLGMGDLNIRSILAQLQNSQFNKRFGLDVGMAEQDANDRAMRTALGL